MNALILGGTGLISGALREEMVRRGWSVTIVTRGMRAAPAPVGVEWLRKDRRDVEGLRGLLQGRTFDVVIDTICFTAEDARSTAELFGRRTAQLIVVSSVAAYRRPLRSLPTREDAEDLCDDPVYAYGRAKAEMESALRDEAARGVPVTIVRPSLTYGDGARNVGVLRQNQGILARIRAGKPLLMFGDGTTPWSFSFAPDIARDIVALVGKSGAIGGAFHLASQERTIWNDLYLEMGRIAGHEPILAYAPARALYEALPELCGHLYFEKSHPGIFDDARLRAVVGEPGTHVGLAPGLRSVVRSWEREGLQPDPARDRLEDRLVEAARAGAAALAAAAKEGRHAP